MKAIDIVWDMETNDPDDFLTLLFLAGHPLVNLKAVTVVPGSPQQIGFVRHALREWFHLDIPVGACNLKSAKSSVSEWHYEAFGRLPPSFEADPADKVLMGSCDHDTRLVMGAPLTNLGTAIKTASLNNSSFEVERLVIQGGFAGQGIVPEALQLDKFRGLTTYPTHNLMVDSKATALALAFSGTSIKYFVSKNVCHRVLYDHKMHDYLASFKDKNVSLSLIWQGMDVYLKKNPAGKLLHDSLTACCAINENIATWAEVELYREGSNWGAKLSPGSGTWIIIDYDHEKFLQTLTAFQ